MQDVKETYNEHFVSNGDGRGDEESTPPEVKGVSVDLPLRNGDEGEFVREIQEELIQAGFPLPQYGADGVFGEETEMAVMRFQRRYGLQVDGLVGQNTLRKLNEVMRNIPSKNLFPLPSGVLSRGDEGTEVRQLQRALQQINFNPGTIDGIYGPRTEDAVRRFQSMYSALKTDGVYGPNTRKYIQMELEDQN
ncbi:peptidoglycan-binding protein [Bacillus salitolerans]|uniref:Peptidoglycan-binding protein n=1 Tax=Bacillus salitolerans TaxID=1437434 RepID=A0ABW4LJ48_9BACI